MMGRVNPPANDLFDGIDELGVRELRVDRPSGLPDHPLNYALGQKRYVLDDGVSSVMKRIAATW